MNVIKRDGTEVVFDKEKIVNAISKANAEESPIHQLNETQIQAIADNVASQVEQLRHAANIEDIQDMVEKGIMEMRGYEVAQKYVRYRYQKNLDRKANTIDGQILSLIDLKNEEVNQENSNKNPVINSTQRDYMAGEVSKDITKRFLVAPDIWKAHEEGIIHFHDADYFAQRMHNCFARNTRFMVYKKGIVSFEDFEDGDTVHVLAMDGVYREATVHCYGKQKLQKVCLSHTSEGIDVDVEVYCTPNHRWILKDGRITTNLKVGDETIEGACGNSYTVRKIYETAREEEVWCVEEPITHSFVLNGNLITGNCCLINMEDMLQNGTVISGTAIDPPKSFSTACTVVSQVFAQVASSQFGCNLNTNGKYSFIK